MFHAIEIWMETLFRYVYKIQWPSTGRPFQTLCIIRSNLHESSYAAHRHRRLACFTFVSLHVRVSHLAVSQPAFMQSARYFGAETVSSMGKGRSAFAVGANKIESTLFAMIFYNSFLLFFQRNALACPLTIFLKSRDHRRSFSQLVSVHLQIWQSIIAMACLSFS